jgi:hypothetical protein
MKKKSHSPPPFPRIFSRRRVNQLPRSHFVSESMGILSAKTALIQLVLGKKLPRFISIPLQDSILHILHFFGYKYIYPNTFQCQYFEVDF